MTTHIRIIVTWG